MKKKLKKRVVANTSKSAFNDRLDVSAGTKCFKSDTFANRIEVSGNEGGSILLTVAVLLVLLSLGSGMMLMFSTSSLQKVGHNLQLRAAHLSEAGFRYAAGEYKSESTLADKYKRLEDLNGETVTLLDNDGGFELEIYPYWFVTTAAHSKGDTSITVKVPGQFANGFESALPDAGRVKIGMDIYDYTGGSASAGSGSAPDIFSLSLTSGLVDDFPVASNVG